MWRWLRPGELTPPFHFEVPDVRLVDDLLRIEVGVEAVKIRMLPVAPYRQCEAFHFTIKAAKGDSLSVRMIQTCALLSKMESIAVRIRLLLGNFNAWVLGRYNRSG